MKNAILFILIISVNLAFAQDALNKNQLGVKLELGPSLITNNINDVWTDEDPYKISPALSWN